MRVPVRPLEGDHMHRRVSLVFSVALLAALLTPPLPGSAQDDTDTPSATQGGGELVAVGGPPAAWLVELSATPSAEVYAVTLDGRDTAAAEAQADAAAR